MVPLNLIVVLILLQVSTVLMSYAPIKSHCSINTLTGEYKALLFHGPIKSHCSINTLTGEYSIDEL